MLEKDPSRRYATAGEAAKELEKVVPDAQRRANALARIVHSARRGRTQSQPIPTIEKDPAARARASIPDSSPTSVQGNALPMPGRLAASRDREPVSRVEVVSPRNTDGGRAPDSPPVLPPPRGPDVRTLVGARDAPARAAPQIRPFPIRFAGKYQVRGPMLSGVDRTVIDQFGRSVRDEVVRYMPPAYAADFLHDSINALIAYDLEALDAYMELATTLFINDALKWRELGRIAANGEVLPAIRSAVRPADNLPTALRRGVTAWSRLMSFGTWRVGTSGDRSTLHVGELDPASLPIRLWLVGLVEGTLQLAMGSDVRASMTLGEIGFMPDLVCEFTT
jgi:serine/threonine-protein kinase